MVGQCIDQKLQGIANSHLKPTIITNQRHGPRTFPAPKKMSRTIQIISQGQKNNQKKEK